MRLLALILSLFLFCLPVQAANTLTTYKKIPAYLNGIKGVTVYKLSHDGASGAADILTPASGNDVYLVGIQVVDDNAATLDIQSGGTSELPINLSANSGIIDRLEPGILFATQEGEKLSIDSTAACVIFLFVQEGKIKNLDGSQ